MSFSTRSVYQRPVTHDDNQIQRIVDFLDDTAVGYEARWGVGRLPALADSELSAKWQSQIEKVNQAIVTGHVADLETLAHGMRRGWIALESHALSSGHQPIDPVAWDFLHASGQVFRVVRNNHDALAAHRPGQSDISIVTLAELVNVYQAACKGVFDSSERASIEREPTETERILDDKLPF